MDWQFLLFNPNGRIGPRDYWIGVAIIIGGNLLADVLPVLGGLLWLLLIWVGLCVYGKRLHDAGRSAAQRCMRSRGPSISSSWCWP